MKSLAGLFLQLFCIVDLEISNGLMPAAGELMMLRRLLILPDEEHAVQIIGFYLCFLVLRPRLSMVLLGSHIMNSPGILWRTRPVHISGGKHLKAQSLVWSHLALRGPGDGLVVAPAEKFVTPGLSVWQQQCREQFVTPLSCFPHSRCNSLALWAPVILYLLLDIYT